MSPAAHRSPRVFMMDLLAIVPYYTAYLSRALLQQNVHLTVGSISYYLDPACFRSRSIRLSPGLLNIVGRFPLPKLPRRVLKLVEATLNLAALSLRFLLSPPDIIHVQYLPMLRSRLPMDLWFIKLLQRRGTKIVLTVHDLLPHDTADRYKRVFKDLYNDVDAIICHSGHIAARLRSEFHVPSHKIDVIPHGPFFYDLPVRSSDKILQSFELQPRDLLFLWQGIIFPYKGIDLLLDAWRTVEDHLPNAQLVIAGTGSPDLLEQIHQQVAQLGLKNVRLHLRFITTEELVTLYRAADVVVYPYRAITTSGALATGLALGKTIIASDLPVFRELLTDQISALLVNPQDPEALASALLRLGRDPNLRETFATRIQSLNFGDQTWQSIARETIEAYQKVLSTSQPLIADDQSAPVHDSAHLLDS